MVELAEVDGIWVARLGGEADASASRRLQEQLLAAAGRSGAGLVVDLSELRYLDSSAVRSLFVVADRLAADGSQLHVVVPRDSRLLRVLRIIQLDTLVQVHESAAEARSALASNSH